MNLAQVEQIARAVLYEGYMLYPYRPSSVKNRQRFNFGVLYPPAYCLGESGSDAASLRMQCLVTGSADTTIEVRMRFLQLQVQMAQRFTDDIDGWQEAIAREVVLPPFTMQTALFGPLTQSIEFLPETVTEDVQSADEEMLLHRGAIQAESEINVEQIAQQLFKISLDLRNTYATDLPSGSRDIALLHSLVSAHLVLSVSAGEFVSLLEPSADLQALAVGCENRGVWPVLVGSPGEKTTLLASPIILYDYPQIAPESPGDLFDGTEIDEILSLRIMTLSDDEKREIRESDKRARQILERTETMPAEQFMKLHGAVRGLRPVKESTP